MAMKCFDYDGDYPITGNNTRMKNTALIGASSGCASFGSYTKSGHMITIKAGTVVFVGGYTIVFTSDEKIGTDPEDDLNVYVMVEMTTYAGVPTPELTVNDTLVRTSTRFTFLHFDNGFVNELNFMETKNLIADMEKYLQYPDSKNVIYESNGTRVCSGSGVNIVRSASSTSEQNRRQNILATCKTVKISFKSINRKSEFFEVPTNKETSVVVCNIGSGGWMFFHEILFTVSGSGEIIVTKVEKWKWNGKATAEGTYQELANLADSDFYICDVVAGIHEFHKEII